MKRDWYMEYTDILMIGDDVKARFCLERPGTKQLIVIGTNPSIANSMQKDNTMECVTWIAQNNGFDGFIMLNLYPQRSTNPDKLDKELNTELHEENLKHIRTLFNDKSSPVILLAFGNLINKRNYLKQCFIDIVSVIQPSNPLWMQLGELTKIGNPRHPLYHTNDKLLDFDMASYLKRI